MCLSAETILPELEEKRFTDFDEIWQAGPFLGSISAIEKIEPNEKSPKSVLQADR